jgi:uncharacterized protein (TIGR02145 family)
MKHPGKLLLLVFCISLITLMNCNKKTEDNTTSTASTFTDFDGNVYHYTTIGTQVWMVENLRVTHYRNGIQINPGTLDSPYAADTSGTFWAYDNNTGYVPDYGLLYNWYAVTDPHGIAPTGWHIPSDAEVGVLVSYLGGDYFALPGGDTVAGGKLKETGNDHWGIQGFPATNVGATNSSHWTGRPGGILFQGLFADLRDYGYFWTNTSDTGLNKNKAYELYLSFNNKNAARSLNFKDSGLSVRCVRDQVTY